MQEQKEKPPEEKVKEEVVPEKTIEDLIKELAILKLKKAEREAQEKQEVKEETGIDLDSIEEKLNSIEEFIEKAKSEAKAEPVKIKEIEKELEALRNEITTKPEAVEEKVGETTYEKLLKEHPWLEETRYEYMYSAPEKKKNEKDYESWLDEWGKVIFDYARMSILHVIYTRKLNSEKPFNKMENRDGAIAAIAQKLIDQNIGTWKNKKKKEAVRIYWKSLDEWGDEIFDWARKNAKTDPILTFELRESGEMFADLPKGDITRIFKRLEKEGKGQVIKMDDGEITFKISLNY